MNEVAERLAKESGQVAETDTRAVAEIRKRIRWEVADHGRKIRIMKCGSKVAGVSNVLMEISATNKNKDLWKLCEKALAERAARVSATGSNRVSHDGIDLGIEVAE